MNYCNSYVWISVLLIQGILPYGYSGRIKPTPFNPGEPESLEIKQSSPSLVLVKSTLSQNTNKVTSHSTKLPPVKTTKDPADAAANPDTLSTVRTTDNITKHISTVRDGSSSSGTKTTPQSTKLPPVKTTKDPAGGAANPQTPSTAKTITHMSTARDMSSTKNTESINTHSTKLPPVKTTKDPAGGAANPQTPSTAKTITHISTARDVSSTKNTESINTQSTKLPPVKTTKDPAGGAANPPTLSTGKKGVVELVGGMNPWQGLVHVVFNGTKGTICDDGFGMEEVRVLCRMLGYSDDETPGFSFEPGGPASGDELPILLDNLQCTGTEVSIFDCQHDGLGVHNCVHAEDISITCRQPEHSTKVPTSLPGLHTTKDNAGAVADGNKSTEKVTQRSTLKPVNTDPTMKTTLAAVRTNPTTTKSSASTTKDNAGAVADGDKSTEKVTQRSTLKPVNTDPTMKTTLAAVSTNPPTTKSSASTTKDNAGAVADSDKSTEKVTQRSTLKPVNTDPTMKTTLASVRTNPTTTKSSASTTKDNAGAVADGDKSTEKVTQRSTLKPVNTDPTMKTTLAAVSTNPTTTKRSTSNPTKDNAGAVADGGKTHSLSTFRSTSLPTVSTQRTTTFTNRCERVTIDTCKPYVNHTMVQSDANPFNLASQDAVASAMQDYLSFSSIRCHEDLLHFVCSVFLPHCQANRIFKPCRSYCLAVKSGCEPLMNMFGFNWPSELNCYNESNFPTEDYNCEQEPAN